MSGILLLLLGGCSATKAAGVRSQVQQPTVVQEVAAPGRGSTPTGQASPQSQSSLPAVAFTSADGSQATIYVEIADTEATQECGLMNRTSMPDDQGMIFIFGQSSLTPFWMKDTLIPLSIAFIDGSGTVVDVQEMQALSEENHNPAKPYRYAIEANAGWYAAHGVAPGDSADVSAAIAASPVYGGAPPLPSPCRESSGS